MEEDKRLWIGNLDPRVTEFQLLKIIQKYGEIEKFDLMFYRTGPLAGQPRGYAFVTYKKAKESLAAMEKLNNIQVGEKQISVRPAKNVNYDELDRIKPKIEIPALAGGSSSSGKLSKESVIAALENKLKALEGSKDDFEINKTAAEEQPIIAKFQFNKNRPQDTGKHKSSYKSASNSRHKQRPYDKKHRR